MGSSVGHRANPPEGQPEAQRCYAWPGKPGVTAIRFADFLTEQDPEVGSGQGGNCR